MSVMTVVPELVTAARDELSGIGSTINDASRTAASPTLGVVAPGADSVSQRVATIFGGHAESYQSVGAQARAFHEQFVETLTASETGYAETDAANAVPLATNKLSSAQTSAHRLLSSPPRRSTQTPSRLWHPGAGNARLRVPRASLTAPRSSVGRSGLLSHAGALPRLGMSHNDLTGEAVNGTRGVVQQIIQNQINYLKTIVASIETFLQDELRAIAALPAAFKQAFHDLMGGHVTQSINDVLRGFAHLFIDGVQWDGLDIVSTTSPTGWMEAVFTGPLTDLAPIWRIPAQELQNTADLLKPLGFGFLGATVQNVASALEAWNNGWHLYLGQGPDAGFTMGAPLALMFDVLGAPALTMRAFEEGLQAMVDNLSAGHPLKAMLDVAATPANMVRAFLFGQGYLELPPFVAKGVTYDGAVHLGGIFAPLGYGKEQVSTLWGGEWTQAGPGRGTDTGGFLAGLWSMMMAALRGWL